MSPEEEQAAFDAAFDGMTGHLTQVTFCEMAREMGYPQGWMKATDLLLRIVGTDAAKRLSR